jgi:hypothetical protein
MQAAIARCGGVPPLIHEVSSEFQECRVYAARALFRWLSRTRTLHPPARLRAVL